jgi:hypothetical protein
VSADGTSSPKGWVDFLASGIERVQDQGDRDEARRLLDQGAYLDAAQVMADALGANDFSMFIRDELVTPRYQPSEMHEQILAIDPKIVITTNYDEIYEDMARAGAAEAGYVVSRYYESHLVNDLRSTRRLILKVHGCVSDPQKVVLTKQQYFDSRRDYPQFFAALDAIFLTHTLLFLGSSFIGDPDIDLLLENAYISAPSEHPHFAVVEAGRHPSVRRALEKTHNIRLLEYEAGSHEEVVDALRRLAEDVEAYRAVGSE